MKVWITKYALSKGLIEIEATASGFHTEGIYVQLPHSAVPQTYYQPDWLSIKADAVIRAEKLRDDRIASLKKQITKLEKLKFA